jgi:hypothetical protein
MKINRFKIKKYQGYSIKIGLVKFELIKFKNNFTVRLEISNWEKNEKQ